MSRLIPKGWTEKMIGELCSVDSESLKNDTPTDFKFRYIDIASVKLGQILDIQDETSFANSPSRARRLVRLGDVLVSTVRPNLKSFAYFDKQFGQWVASTGFAVLRANEGTDGMFIFNAMLGDEMTSLIDKSIAGSNYPAISSKELRQFSIATPPLAEQKKIAEILTSVDDVIENTQAQIDKLQDLKKATMNELLTKGIGHTEFKDSELGRIPKTWEVKNILNTQIQILDGDRGKHYPKQNDFENHGYCLFLSAKNITKSGFKFNETSFISQIKDERMRKGKVFRDDIVITTRGTVGNLAFFNEDVPYGVVRINSGMAIIRNKDDRIIAEYLYCLLNSEIIASQIRFLTFGSAQPQLTIGTLKSLFVLVPPKYEQQKIVKAINKLNNILVITSNKLHQIQSLKKALMNDLLTGKVRVN